MDLAIKSIGANETINLDMFPATDYDLDGNKKLDVWILAEAVTAEKNSYVSNKLIRNVKNYTADIDLAQQGIYEDGKIIDASVDKLNDGDKINFKAIIKNNEENERTVTIEYNLDEMIDVQNAKIETSNGEEDVLSIIEYNNLNKEGQKIKPGETVTLNLEGVVDALETESITNNLKVVDSENGRILKNNITFAVNKTEDINDTDDSTDIDNYEDLDDNNNGNNSNNGNNNNGNNNPNESNGNNQNPGNNEQNQNTVYTVSGKAWIDTDKDGRRSNADELKGELEVNAMDSETGKIVATTKTATDGTYSVQLPKGKYMIIFKYDSKIYTTTSYQIKDANETENSDAMERTISVDGLV